MSDPLPTASGSTTPPPNAKASPLSPARIVLVGTLLLTVLTVFTFPPRYDTNDDAAMNAIAAGQLLISKPDEHLLYTNVAIGLPLSWLYSAAPRVPWYGLYQLVTLGVSALVFAYVFIRINPTWKQVALTFIHFGVVVVPCLALIQFTKTAFLAVEAGAFLLLGPLFVGGKWPRWTTVAGMVLILLGAAIRFESFLLAALLMGPLGLAAFIRRPPGCRWGRIAVIVAAGGAGAILLNYANQEYYARSPGWEKFHEFNALFGEFVNYHAVEYTPQTKPAFDAVGWDELDFRMLMNWFYVDRDKYSEEKLRRILTEAPRQPPAPASSRTPDRTPGIGPPSYDGVGLWVVLLPAAVLTGGSRSWLLPFGLFALGVLFALIIAGSFQYLPARVWFCLFCPAVAAAVLFAEGEFLPRTEVTAIAQKLAVVAAVALLIWQAVQRWEEWQARAEIQQLAEDALRSLDSKPDQLYVIWAAGFPYEQVLRPFGTSDSARSMKCTGLLTALQTPILTNRLDEFGIENIDRALYQRKDVYLIAHPLHVELFREYVKRRYGENLEVRTIRPAVLWKENLLVGTVVQLTPAKAPEPKLPPKRKP